MDRGPFRANQQGERRATVTRPEPVRQQPKETSVEPSIAAPRVVSDDAPREKQSSKKRPMGPIITGVIVLLAILIGWFAWTNLRGGATGVGIDNSKYQAVFFTNGQVYFGKLKGAGSEYLRLTDIFYLQASGAEDVDNPQNAGESGDSVQLIKLGDEVHGPEDEMIISKDQVLFYENLKTNSKVSETIKKYKN